VYRDRRRLLAAFAASPALALAGCTEAALRRRRRKSTITPEQAKSGFPHRREP
jgi:sulfoxide reductase catalytic subunit YedY